METIFTFIAEDKKRKFHQAAEDQESSLEVCTDVKQERSEKASIERDDDI